MFVWINFGDTIFVCFVYFALYCQNLSFVYKCTNTYNLSRLYIYILFFPHVLDLNYNQKKKNESQVRHL